MKRFLTRKELKVKRKELTYTIIGIAVILSLYFIFTREKKPAVEMPVVSVMPANQQNVQIFGEYVGRIRAQQFVEVRARVEGFLEQMLFEEGTSSQKKSNIVCHQPGPISRQSRQGTRTIEKRSGTSTESQT